MAQRNIFTDLNLNGNQVINAIVENVASLPPVTAKMAGRWVFLTTDNKFYRCNGTQWLSDTTGGNTIVHYQSDPLVGTSGIIQGSESGLKTTGKMPILQANKAGEVVEIAMTWTSSGQIEWSSNKELTGEDKVTIVAIQKQ